MKTLRRSLTSALVVLAIATSASAQVFQIETTYSGGNSQDGNMFDVQSSQDILISDFEINAPTGSHLVHVYYSFGGHAGKTMLPSAWHFVDAIPVVGLGLGSKTPVSLPFGIPVKAGQTMGLYLTLVSGDHMAYSPGTFVGDLIVTDGTVSILVGTGNTYPFMESFSPRRWNGTLHYTLGSGDCNGNGIGDDLEISGGTSPDCNANGIPDECERDCNVNGILDACEIAAGTVPDCNGNGIPDTCDIASGHSFDQDGDGVPDDCFLPTLYANASQISLAAGGTVAFQMKTPPLPGPSNLFLLLGSASGTNPGIQSGPFTLPLNQDAYMMRTFDAPNQPPFTGSMGALLILGTGYGFGSSSLTLPPGLIPPSLVGLTLHHAYVVVDTQTGQLVHVTNAVPLNLAP